MASRHSQINSNSNNTSNTKPVDLVAVVMDVILDENHETIQKKYRLDGIEEKNLEEIGSVVVRPTWNTVDRKKPQVLRPLDRHNTDYPIIGETVEIVSQAGLKFYRRISSQNLNTGNAKENADLVITPNENNSATGNTQTYKETSATGTGNASSTNQKRTSKYGQYFEPLLINHLKPYEGDKIIQSRFGQSIRFSGYNNDKNSFSPTIVIRNGQGQRDTKYNSIIEEDINLDGSTIIMSSGEYQSKFVATTDINPSKFSPYPSPLKGNQLILNSDRIILSAMAGEMIFHSKGNYGFISDGKFSIDNGLGAELDFGGNVIITTSRNNSNVSINSGSGKIFLNTNTSGKSPNTGNSSEPLVRGNTLKQLLETMIDLINSQVYRTPSGPTAVGPENRGEFNSLKRRLAEMLSTLNYTE